MANSIGRVIPLTSAMNVEFNELAGLMAAMSKTGTPVEEAVVSIQAIMTTLLNPTREAEDALSDVGLTLADLRKQVADEGVLPMLVGLKEAFDGNIESTAAVFGNVRALRGVLDLLGPQMQGNIELLDEMADSTGVLKEATEAAQQTIGFKMRQASVHGQIALLEFGRAIEPIARFIFDALTPALQRVIRWFQSGNPVVRTLAQGVAILGIGLIVLSGALFSVAAAAKVVSFALGGLSVAGTILHGILNLLSIAWWRNVAAQAASRIAMIAGTVATIAASAATWAFNAALLANPITWIVLGIVGLIAALVLLVKHWDTVTDALKFAWNWIKGNWPLLASILLGPFGIVGALIWKFRDEIIGAFVSIKDGIIGAWQAVVDFIMDKFNMVKELPGKLLDAIPGGGLIRQAAGLLRFAEGGIVPGPLGRPLLATVHGGEMVLPVGASRVIAQMLEGFRLGPAALPQAPHYYGQMYRSSVVNRTVNINMNEPIVIQTQATDAKGIAQELGEAIQDQIRNIAYDHDGPVER